MQAARAMGAGVAEAGGVQGAETALMALEEVYGALSQALQAAGTGTE